MRRPGLAALLSAAITGCSTNPYAMRDYGAVIEQARKVGVGSSASPVKEGKRAPEEVTAPCIVDGRQVGTYTRTLQPDGTLAYAFSEGCSAPNLERTTP